MADQNWYGGPAMAKPIVPEGIPFGFCQCGCGNLAPIAKKSHRRSGHVRGQPVRFIHAHSSRIQPRDRRPLADRFWEKVRKDGPIIRPELGKCWLWIGTKNRKGY